MKLDFFPFVLLLLIRMTYWLLKFIRWRNQVNFMFFTHLLEPTVCDPCKNAVKLAASTDYGKCLFPLCSEAWKMQCFHLSEFIII